MQTYRLASGVFVGTQADAKASGEKWEPVEVPTNPKADLIKFLNELSDERKVDVNPKLVSDGASTAMQVITENETGKATVDAAIHTVMTCGTTTLGRFATAISMRYGQLGKGKRK